MDEGNAEYVRLFLEGRGIAEGSAENYRVVLTHVDRVLGGLDFKVVTEEAMRRFMRSRRHLKTSTLNREKGLLKHFFRCLHGYRKYTYPPCVDWLQKSVQPNTLPVVDASDLLTEEAVKAVMDSSYSTRDRALWMTLWEGGVRISEALSMRVSSLVFDEYGCYCLVSGKTGQRRIRFVQATPYLREYLNVHPGQGQPLGWLWVAEGTTRRLHRSTIRRNLEKAVKRAGMQKHVWPHLFRHSRLTLNAKFMTEAELCVFAGWQQGSPQTHVYVHLAGVDLDDKILAHYGLKKAEELQGEKVLKPLVCPRCGEENPATGRFCYKCSAALTLEEAMKLEDAKDRELKGLQQAVDSQQQSIKNLEQALNLLSQALRKRGSAHTDNLAEGG